LILLDTHVVIWAVNDDRRLGGRARRAIDAATAADGVAMSAITPWEIALLVSRGRVSLGREVGAWMTAVLALPGMRLAPLETAIALASVSLPGNLHSDPADRIMVATARHHGWPLVSADAAILDYATAGHVRVLDATR
jgi:PIN domain nuclease of toxin-antitoxin system